MNNQYLPVGISLKNRPCLIVGGGNVALRKIETLLDYDAAITVIAPSVVDKIEYYRDRNKLKLIKREYVESDIAEFGLVIAASDNADVNHTVYKNCRKAGIPINVVDSPRLCDFIFPATIMRDCLTISIMSDGKAPFLSGQLRMILEDIFPSRWEKIARWATIFREKVHKRWKGFPEKKAACFETFVAADWTSLLKDLSDDEINSELDKMLES